MGQRDVRVGAAGKKKVLRHCLISKGYVSASDGKLTASNTVDEGWVEDAAAKEGLKQQY